MAETERRQSNADQFVERRRRVGQEIAAVLQGRLPRSVVNREVLEKVSLA